jgi:hypothetical protein
MLSIPSAVLQIILMLALAKSSEYFNERTFHCFIGEFWSLPLLAALLALPARGYAWGRFTLTTMISGCKSTLPLPDLIIISGKYLLGGAPLGCSSHGLSLGNIRFPSPHIILPTQVPESLINLATARPILPPHPLGVDLGKLLQRQKARPHGGDLQRDRADRLAHRLADLPRRRRALLLPRQQGTNLDLRVVAGGYVGTKVVVDGSEQAEGGGLGDDGRRGEGEVSGRHWGAGEGGEPEVGV